MKHRVILVLLAALIAGVASSSMVLASLEDRADEHEFGQPASSGIDSEPTGSPVILSAACASGHACFWKQKDFDGDREEADASLAEVDRYLGPCDRSMKNRFGGRKVLIKDYGFQVADCINAGGDRNNLVARADIFRIGQTGSSC